MSGKPALSIRGLIATTCLWLAVTANAFAGGPRWVTGPPYFSTSGNPVVWYTSQLLYFTDPGDLSDYVDHAAADAIVAAAANTWNVPTASLTLANGGSLDEHVSGSNVYPGAEGLVFPSDVQSSNYQAKQIAVIYDTDGSITDLLLGSGASDSSSCRQNAVTESADSIVPAGYIQHALLILNGRCTGPAPEQQLQMQYQLMRAFGRILGIGWSQVNDNVFTGSPAPTYYQALNWPIMHPIDIICGPYTYQCLPQPFTLRPDDLSALAMLYPIPRNQAPPGKVDSQYRANEISGTLLFPTGQGMQGVNVVSRRLHQAWNIPEAWQSVSSVSGFRYKGSNGNPVTGPPTSTPGNGGSLASSYEGYYDLRRIPMLDGTWQNVILDTEPINPLYTGEYAVGPYIVNQVQPSGSDAQVTSEVNGSYYSVRKNLSTTNATSNCTPADGTEAAPAEVDASGWWTGTLCAYGHTGWSALSGKANRSFTIEVTALDERGFVTTAKAMPVIGVWNATDALGTLPTVASAPVPFNGAATGMTTLTLLSQQASQLRIAIADQRGDGRPDFAYKSRVLYADNVAPANVSALGGVVTITGMGFRTGDLIAVNGVTATVSSWTATSIIAIVPSSHALGFSTAQSADITVTDPSTGGTTVMSSALNYAAPLPTLNLLNAPSGSVFVGDTAATQFAVKALAADGVTPMANQPVTFTSTGGAVRFGACASSTCTIMTNLSGSASTTVTPLEPGTVVLSATSTYGIQSASFTALDRIRTIDALTPVQYVAADTTVLWKPQVSLADNSASTAGVVVNWQTAAGPMLLSPTQSQANAQGIVQTLATSGPLAAGAKATASACAWTTVCTTFATQAVDPADWRIEIVSGAGQSVGTADTLLPLTLRVVDAASHPIAGVVVQIHQTIESWQMPCPDRGQCPIAPIDDAQVSSVTSDVNGLITIAPLQITGQAEVTNIVAATGTQGFVSLALQKQP